MKILAPVNKPEEVEIVIGQGADELYCGVLPSEWRARFTNVASPNRREWTSANLKGFGELERVVGIAHSHHTPVFLTVNALYTEEQYPLVVRQIERARRIGIDAFIVADLGLLLLLKEMRLGIDIHISNTGTTFNSETVEFYKELGASRIILPRHLIVDEIVELVEMENGIEFEVFIMNSGCKNIDGFCTFHHGVNEILHPRLWNLPKRLNFDLHLLELVRRLPCSVSSRIKGDIFGIDSACLLNYKVSLISNSLPPKEASLRCKEVSAAFSLLSGADPCGACDLYRLRKLGIDSVKIVGRNYLTSKKIKDVGFLKKRLQYLEEDRHISEEEFRTTTKAEYKNIYKADCKNLCYRHR